jgi:hypothetical protein
MPVKVGRYGKWVDAEALTSDAIITVKISDSESLRTMKRDGWIAIEPSVLQKGASSPGSFQPSANVIPGTTEILPQGYAVVTEAMNLVPGTPVRAIWLNTLSDATVVSVEGKLVMTHYDGQASAFDKKVDRSALVISNETIAELDKPGAAERFRDRIPKVQPIDNGMDIQAKIDEQAKKNEAEAKRIEEMVQRNLAAANNGFPSTGGLDNGLPALPLLLQNNPIDIPIPKEAELVPLDFPLPRGTKLAVCWGRKWNYVTVLKDNKEDTIPVHWDDRPPASDGLIHRTQLIIRRSDLKKLRIKATRDEKRIWTDITGKHKVEAKMLSRTSSQVTLIKDDGKEVTLSIDTLSLGSESGECGRWDSSRAPSPSWWPLLVVADGVEAKISRFLIVICASPDRCTSAVVMRTCRFIFARSLSKTLLRWKTAETFSVRSECSMSSSVYALNSRGLSEAERVGTSMSVALRSLDAVLAKSGWPTPRRKVSS